MPHEIETDLILKAVNWTAAASEAINDAGGYAPMVLKSFSRESLNTLVRNDLFITYKKPGGILATR